MTKDHIISLRKRRTLLEQLPDILRGLAPLAIIIMGVSGSGKSTLGTQLADILEVPFLEGDTFHTPEAVAKMRAGEPLTDEDRWPWLDRIGHAVNGELAQRGAVIASCSALKRSYRDQLRETIRGSQQFVLLESDREELGRRVANRPGHYMPASLLSSQLEALERPLPEEHVLTLDARHNPSVLCDEIIGWLKNNQKA